MSNVIHKFILDIDRDNLIALPESAQFLTAQIQEGILVVWALINRTERQVSRHLRVYMTGQPIGESIRSYIATVQAEPIVLHVFEVEP